MESLENPKLLFEEEAHKYTYEGEEFLSVTTWIKSLNPPFKPFDAQKIAPYSAAKRGITTEEMLAEWEAKRDKAAKKGTFVHNEIERRINGEEFLFQDPVSLMLYNWLTTRSNLDLNGAMPHPEVRLAHPELKVAGTVDLVVERKKSVTIIDWKTNGELFSTYDIAKTRKLENLRDCKYSMYALQLSVYAYILETVYKRKVSSLWLVHGNEDGVTPMRVPYLKKLVIQMVEQRMN